MVMSILNNTASLNAQRSLYKAGNSLQTSMGKLSSGQRITSASEDSAGLAISEKLRGEVRGLQQAARNSQDGVSMIQTAEGAMEEVHSMLQRMRELAVQGSNDTLDASDRGFINDELQQLKAQINDIGDRTEYNGKTLLSGTLVSSLATGTEIAAGTVISSGGTVVSSVDVSGVRNAATAQVTLTFTGDSDANTLTLTNGTTNVAQTIDFDDAAYAAPSAGGSATYDFAELGVKITVSTDASGAANHDNIINTLKDAGSNEIKVAGAATAGQGSVEFLTGPDEGDSFTMAFRNIKVDTAAAGASTEMDALNTKLSAFNTSVNNGAGTQAASEDLIGEIDASIQYISDHRSELGSYQNRLEYTINNLQQSAENLTAAESRIRDVDVASESAEMAKSTVLQQAALSVLAQANQQPQMALKLIG